MVKYSPVSLSLSATLSVVRFGGDINTGDSPVVEALASLQYSASMILLHILTIVTFDLHFELLMALMHHSFLI